MMMFEDFGERRDTVQESNIVPTPELRQAGHYIPKAQTTALPHNWRS